MVKYKGVCLITYAFLNPQRACIKRVFKSVFHCMLHELPTWVFDPPFIPDVDEIKSH